MFPSVIRRFLGLAVVALALSRAVAAVPAAHAASFTIDGNFVTNAKQYSVQQPDSVNDCTRWISQFLETYYMMPSSLGSAHTDDLINNLINDGDAQVLTGDGNYDPDGFIDHQTAADEYFSEYGSFATYLDSLRLENGGSEEFIIAYKWNQDNYPGGELASHLAVYVGNGQVVSHGTDGWNSTPKNWDEFTDEGGIQSLAIIALTNSDGSNGGNPGGNGSFNISLSADQTNVSDGTTVNLTADTNVDVGNTPYYIDIVDTTQGQSIGTCGTGTTCTEQVAMDSDTTDTFVAYIDDGNQGDVQAQSNGVQVTWEGGDGGGGNGGGSSPWALGGVDLNGYCQSIGYDGVSLDGTTAYDWHCDDSWGNTYDIDMDAACQWQYPDNSDVYAVMGDYNNPDSWVCYGD